MYKPSFIFYQKRLTQFELPTLIQGHILSEEVHPAREQ